jgi:hypothetical protein
MTQVVGIARRARLSGLTVGVWRGASRVAAWARAERHTFFAPPAAGAFHGETPPSSGYLTQMRSSWGRP